MIANDGHRHEQIFEQDDICVDEQPERVPSNVIDSCKRVIEPRRAARTAGDFPDVLDPGPRGDLGDAGLVADEHDLDFVSEKSPAVERDLLVTAHVSLERLRQCDERQHPQDDPEPTARRAP